MKKKVALITGASSGIGESAAVLLHKAGFKVYGAARRVEKMKSLEEKGISDAVCSLMFQEDIDDARKDAEKFSWYSRLNSARRAVILNMIFNMGLTRFSGFKKTIEYIDQGLYLSASKEMKDSKWYREDVANSRSDRLAEMMRTGTWPENFS